MQFYEEGVGDGERERSDYPDQRGEFQGGFVAVNGEGDAGADESGDGQEAEESAPGYGFAFAAGALGAAPDFGMREIFFVEEDAEEKPVSEIGGDDVKDYGVENVRCGHGRAPL